MTTKSPPSPPVTESAASEPVKDATTLSLIRRALLVILLIGVVGMVAELVMLKHTEGFWQLAPVGLLLAALPILVWLNSSRSVTSLRTLQLLMGIYLASGIAGVLLHYQGNAVYEMESMPGIGGWDLFSRAALGASPTLAPGTMILLGLIGLAYTFRYPGIRRPAA